MKFKEVAEVEGPHLEKTGTHYVRTHQIEFICENFGDRI